MSDTSLAYEKAPPRADSAHPAFITNRRRRRASAPDPDGGDKFVDITYTCGKYICDGQLRFPYSRLRRFSKRARRELRSAGAACPVGGTLQWNVDCQHYEQDLLLGSIFDWFRELPNIEPRSDFVQRGYHPAIDPKNEWVLTLTWRELLLLDHTLDYLHLREPLDNKKVRCLIWQLLTLDELEINPLTADDVHLAWNLLQFKSRWAAKAATYDGKTKPTPAVTKNCSHSRQVSSTSVMSCRSISSTAEQEMSEIFKGWDCKNSALMQNIIRKVAAYLEKRGTNAFDNFINELEMLGAREDNEELIWITRRIYETRNNRPAMRSVSDGSVDRAWIRAVGQTMS